MGFFHLLTYKGLYWSADMLRKLSLVICQMYDGIQFNMKSKLNTTISVHFLNCLSCSGHTCKHNDILNPVSFFGVFAFYYENIGW